MSLTIVSKKIDSVREQIALDLLYNGVIVDPKAITKSMIKHIKGDCSANSRYNRNK